MKTAEQIKFENRSKSHSVHGHASKNKKSKTYKSWDSMIARCELPKHKSFHRYGGRGIKVCARWHKFKNFLADMGVKPEGMSIERKNNDGNYTPKNCRWATKAEQNKNRADNRQITFKSQTKTLSQWSRDLGIPTSTLFNRLKAGWTIESALTIDSKLYRKRGRKCAAV